MWFRAFFLIVGGRGGQITGICEKTNEVTIGHFTVCAFLYEKLKRF